MVIKQNKRLTAALLGVCSLQMLLPLFLSLLVLSVKITQQNTVSELALNSSAFQQLTVPEGDKDLQFSADDEVLYKGTLYDIRSIKKENGAYTMVAMPDSKETRLAKFNNSIAEKDHKTSSDDIKVLPFFFLYFEHSAPWRVAPAVAHQPAGLYSASLIIFQPDILTPPPRC